MSLLTARLRRLERETHRDAPRFLVLLADDPPAQATAGVFVVRVGRSAPPAAEKA